MLSKLIKRIGFFLTIVISIFVAIVSSLIISIIIMLIAKGYITTLGLIMSVLVPSIIATPMIIFYGKSLLKISDIESEMRQLLTYDPLTEVLSRRMINEFAQELILLSEREKHDISFLYCDLDFFKDINDTYGHQIGDFVLKETGKILKKNIRKSDLVGRLGGEEFLIILPETDSEGALILAVKLKKIFSDNWLIINDIKLNVTISIGICSYSDLGKYDFNMLLSKADSSLYKSKKNGRNKITVYKPENE